MARISGRIPSPRSFLLVEWGTTLYNADSGCYDYGVGSALPRSAGRHPIMAAVYAGGYFIG